MRFEQHTCKTGHRGYAVIGEKGIIGLVDVKLAENDPRERVVTFRSRADGVTFLQIMQEFAVLGLRYEEVE